jgi:hypothetical protein
VERYTPAAELEAAHGHALEMQAARGHAAKLVALVPSQALTAVPNTVEAWQAYADRVKASRDAAEAEVGRLLRELLGLADRWERTVQAGGMVVDPWATLRAVLRG